MNTNRLFLQKHCRTEVRWTLVIYFYPLFMSRRFYLPQYFMELVIRESG